MFNSISRLFSKTRRTGAIHPGYFEALEARQLLSAANYDVDSFKNSVWHVVGQTYEGSFTVAANSASISGGSVTTDSGVVIDLTGDGFSFTTGAGKGIITLTHGVSSDPDYFEINARLASTDDYATGGDRNGLGQAVVIRQPGDAFKDDSTSELIGNWSVTGEETTGSFSIAHTNSKGLYLSAASLRVDGRAVGFSVARSTVELDTATGEVTITLKNSAGTQVRLFTGYLTDAGDFIGLKETSDESGNDMLVALKVGARGSYSSSDLVDGKLWSLSGDETNGRFVLSAPDAKGVATITASSLRIYLGGNDIDGTVKPVWVTGANATGTLTMDRNGRATLRLTVNPGTAAAFNLTLTGQMNSTKNSIALLSADGSTFMILTTNTDHPVEFTNAGKTVALPVVAANQDVPYTFDDLAELAGIHDIDGDALPGTIYIKNTAGTLTVDDVLQDNDEWIAITSASDVVWNSGAAFPTRATRAFQIATNNTPDDNEIVSFTTRRVANAVNVTASDAAAAEPVGAGDPNPGQFKITRAITGAQSVVFTLSSLNAADGTDYDVFLVVNGVNTPLDAVGGKYTAAFADNEKSLLINIVPIGIADRVTTDRTVTLTLETPAANSGYELGTRKTAAVKIRGNYTTADTAVSVAALGNQKVVVQDGTPNTITFVISRANINAGNSDLSVTPSFSLDSDRIQTTEVSFDNGVTWDPLVGTVDFTGSVTSARVRYTLKADTDNVIQTTTAAFSVAIANADNDEYYVSPAKSSVVVTVKDNAPTVKVAKSGSLLERTESTATYTISRTGATTDPLVVTFDLTGSATAGSDYTITGATSTNDLAHPNRYTATILAGATKAVVSIKALNDNLRTEGTEDVTLTLVDTSYLVGTGPSTFTITDYTLNAAPTVATAATVTGKSFVNDNTTTTTLSVTELAGFTNANDDVDADADLTFRVTAISPGVTLTIGGNDYTSASTLTDVTISGVQLITVKVADTVTAGAAVALFSVKAVDTEDAESTATSVVSGAVGQIPELTTGTIAGTFQQNAAATVVSFADLVAATNPTDDGLDTALIFVVTSIQPGVTLVIDTVTYTSGGVFTSTTITTGETFTIAVDASVNVSVTASLFTVKAVDATELESNAVVITGNVTAA